MFLSQCDENETFLIVNTSTSTKQITPKGGVSLEKLHVVVLVRENWTRWMVTVCITA